MIEGFIGIALGVMILVGVQFACYKLCVWKDYHKAVAISLASVIVSITAVLTLIKIFGD